MQIPRPRHWLALASCKYLNCLCTYLRDEVSATDHTEVEAMLSRVTNTALTQVPPSEHTQTHTIGKASIKSELEEPGGRSLGERKESQGEILDMRRPIPQILRGPRCVFPP